jgi:flagellar biosynthetic protein FliQ
MTPDVVLLLARDSGIVLLYVAIPVLGAGLITGVVVSIFQAVTQVQEASLSFVPKLAAILLVFAFLGHWMLAQLVGYTVTLFSSLDVYGH